MNHQFKPGDLALTIFPIPCVEAGSLVSLETRIEAGESFRLYGQVFTAVQPGWLCSKVGVNSLLAYAETSLMPLRGDVSPEQQKSREVAA